jgi:hypothetical protein
MYLNGARDPMDPAYIQPVRASKVEEADGRLVFIHSDGTIAAFFFLPSMVRMQFWAPRERWRRRVRNRLRKMTCKAEWHAWRKRCSKRAATSLNVEGASIDAEPAIHRCQLRPRASAAIHHGCDSRQ